MNTTCLGLTALLVTVALASGSAHAVAPSPIGLADTSHIVIAARACRQQKALQERIADRTRVQALVAEFTALRVATESIQAAKFSCPTRVEFFNQELKLTSIEVLPCNAFEQAPVPGKRYFVLKGGMSKLPQLSRLVSAPVRAACDDA